MASNTSDDSTYYINSNPSAPVSSSGGINGSSSIPDATRKIAAMKKLLTVTDLDNKTDPNYSVARMG